MASALIHPGQPRLRPSASGRQAEQSLMQRVARGDGDAFRRLYLRHRAGAYRQALEITRSPAVAEEVTQDAFLTLWRSAARFDSARGGLGTWLASIVRNRSIDALRRTARHSRLVALEGSPAEELQSPERVDEETVERAGHHDVRRLLSVLPAEQREVLFLGYYAGLTQPEIAACISRPVGTVKSRQRLGLEKLSRELLAAA